MRRGPIRCSEAGLLSSSVEHDKGASNPRQDALSFYDLNRFGHSHMVGQAEPGVPVRVRVRLLQENCKRTGLREPFRFGKYCPKRVGAGAGRFRPATARFRVFSPKGSLTVGISRCSSPCRAERLAATRSSLRLCNSRLAGARRNGVKHVCSASLLSVSIVRSQ
jgi:hypothetical protein